MAAKVKLYTMADVAALCLNTGIGGWPTISAVAIAWAESGGNAYATNINDGDPTSVAYLSIDLGMWQTNSYWHPEVKPREAFDPELQFPHVLRIAQRRTGQYGYISYNWTAWSTYNAGTYKKFITPAYNAVKALGGV